MTNSDLRLIEKAKSYVNELLGQEATGHDYFHAQRVYRQAMRLAKNKDANLTVIGLASLLHDLDDKKISQGTSRALDFLKRHNVLETQEIMDIIDNMSFSSHLVGKKVTSLEGKIVQDADRLDALGAIGIARCFSYSGKKQRPLYLENSNDDTAIAHFYQKLFKLPDLMNTEEARQIALERVEFMKKYLQEFYKEWSE